ncbi:MAG: hypothetical protein P8Y53_01260 [Pseudolabrys sp.]
MNLVGILQTNLGTPSLWIGLVTVFVFAAGRFNETRRDLEGLDPPILVRNFTTRFRYNFALVTYGGTACFFYITLICLGSIPNLQEYLKDWIGSVPGIGNAEVGTPSWAALAITAALPTVRPVARFDQSLRDRLHDFASIPLKAQSIADEVIAEIRREQGVPDPDEKQVYEALVRLLGQLRHLKRLRAAESYREFFAKNDSMIEQIGQKAANLPEVQASSPEQSRYYQNEWETATKRLARLVVCALLTVEVDEFSVRRTLRDDLKLSGIRVNTWRFTSTQIVFSLVIVVIVTVVAALTTNYIGLVLSPESEITASLVLKLTGRFIAAGLFWGPAFLIPLLFCAGMRMYLIDLNNFGEKLEWDTHLLFFLITALGALLFALLCTVIAGVLINSMIDHPPKLVPILLWAGPPALFALTFFILSSQDLFSNRAWNAVSDFFIHGSLTGVSGWLAAHASISAGFDFQILFIPENLLPYTAAVTSALIGGTLGTVLCLISRAHEYAAPVSRRPATERVHAAITG